MVVRRYDHRRRPRLRKILVNVGVIDDLVAINAALIKDRLEGYTSESDSLEIYQALFELKGTQVDQVLRRLETITGKERSQLVEWLFGDMIGSTLNTLVSISSAEATSRSNTR